MALRRAIGSAAQAYLRRRVLIADPPPAPPSFRRPPAGLSPCRSFAVPPHLVKKKKEEEEDAARKRINNDITAPFIRLVSDEGHNVVSRHEALQLAARMEMDLVEVDRKADPPVCRIMDFYKEKYKKDVTAKERLKAKSAIALRGGDNKEVRFKGKTDLKDLKTKADAITRLMERGYRVKCMAMPTAGKEDEDLGSPLSRLLDLIKDVCIVESGPHLDSKHAYVIVRHVKFGTKKGGKKASQAIEDAGKGTLRNIASESPAAAVHGLKVEDGAISDHIDEKPAHLSDTRREFRENMQRSEQALDSRNGNSYMEKQEKTNEEMAPVQTNRYATRRPQIGRDNQSRYPQDPRRNESEDRYRVNNNQGSFEQPNRPPLPRFNQGRLPQEPSRNERGGHIPLSNNQRPFQAFQQLNPSPESAGIAAGNPASTAKNLGIFSSRKPATPELKKTDGAPAGRPDNADPSKSFGIFSPHKS